MKSNCYFLIAVLSALLLSGCAKEIPGAFWGETEHYKKFLWKDYEPIRMEQTLVFDFNQDSKKLLTKPVRFEIVEKDLEGNFFRPDDIDVYVNGKLCQDNIFSVTKDDTEIPLCIIFKDDAREGNHTLFLQEDENNNNGLDRVDYLQLDKGFVVKKKDVTNPLRVGTDISLSTILAILVAWILLVQLSINRFRNDQIRTIKFTIEDGNPKCINSKNSSLVGSKEIILTKTTAKQSFLKMLFFGKISYVKIDEIPCEVKFKPGRKNKKGQVVLDTRHPGFKKSDFETYTEGEKNEIKVLNSTVEDTKIKIEFNYKGR